MAEGGEEMRIGKWSLPQREECTFQLEKSIERVGLQIAKSILVKVPVAGWR